MALEMAISGSISKNSRTGARRWMSLVAPGRGRSAVKISRPRKRTRKKICEILRHRGNREYATGSSFCRASANDRLKVLFLLLIRSYQNTPDSGVHADRKAQPHARKISV